MKRPVPPETCGVQFEFRNEVRRVRSYADATVMNPDRCTRCRGTTPIGTRVCVTCRGRERSRADRRLAYESGVTLIDLVLNIILGILTAL